MLPLLAAVLIRSGVLPFHCWMTDLFEHATFGTALLFVTPMAGAYAAVRLVLPIAPDWVLQSIGLVSLVTAVYAAGMALVQREARRFFCYLFLSHSALVLVGLETRQPDRPDRRAVRVALGRPVAGRLRPDAAGAGSPPRPAVARRLSRPVRAHAAAGGLLPADRAGQRRLSRHVRLCRHRAAGRRRGAGVSRTSASPSSIAAALNGIAVVQAYFRLFTGTRHVSSVPLQVGLRERFAVLTLAALILGGGLFPQPGVRVARITRRSQPAAATQIQHGPHESPQAACQRLPNVGIRLPQNALHGRFTALTSIP